MTYTLSIPISLGSSQTGLTLSAQLVNTAGSNVGSAISTGFVELGGGTYLWTSSAFPDGFRGAVTFLSGSDVLAVAGINPEEAEYVDQKVSVAGETSPVGPGSVAHPVLVTRPGGYPLEGAAVWVSTDSAGANVVAGTVYTDTLGRATVWLDPGDYYLWQQHGGYRFTNPTAFTVEEP